ncbi:hypothetical protein [Acetobacter sp.]
MEARHDQCARLAGEATTLSAPAFSHQVQVQVQVQQYLSSAPAPDG